MDQRLSRLRGWMVLYLLVHASASGQAPPTASAPGILFFKGSWQAVLAEAQRQNKPIFLDMYTRWCPPCKRMAREAFPDPKLGAKFNVHFINYQLDAEKGEGLLLAKQYTVSSYPTGLYIAPSGSLVHRSVGYAGIGAMIDLADQVLDFPQLKATVAKGDKDFAKGRREPAFLKKYLKTRQDLNRPLSDVLDAYLDVLPASERNTAETILFVAQQLESSTSYAFDYLIKTRYGLLAENVTSAVSSALHRALTNDLNRALATNDETLLEKTIANTGRNIASTNPDQFTFYQQETANFYRLYFFEKTRNFGRYSAIAKAVVQSRLMNPSANGTSGLDSGEIVQTTHSMVLYPDAGNDTLAMLLSTTPKMNQSATQHAAFRLQQIAETYGQLATSVPDWELALAWTERSASLYRNPTNLATRARLLKKLGRVEEAITSQKAAIEAAQKAGQDTTPYEKELADIHSKAK